MPDEPVSEEGAPRDAVELARHAGRVRYLFGCPEVEDEWVVESFELDEALNRAYRAHLRLSCEDADADPLALLGQDVEVRLDRGTEQPRRVLGIVGRVVLEEENTHHHQSCSVEVVPALWALSKTEESRIFQGADVILILEEVLAAHLAPYGRSWDLSALGRPYLPREYCVQYRESAYDFVNRLCEDEGIGYRFDAVAGDRETLVFFEANAQLPKAHTLDLGPVRFDVHARAVHGAEPVVQFHPAEQLGTTAYTLRDHDWTREVPRVEHEQDGTDGKSRRRAVYEHGFGAHARSWEYRDHRFHTDDVERRAATFRELLVRDARRAEGVSLVTGLAAGTILRLIGHPTPEADGDWVVTTVRHSSAPHRARGRGRRTETAETDYHNTFECIPYEAPYRPDRATPSPRIYGSQTAKVVGAGSEEIHTDHYGRVKVQFHWDRDTAEDESCSLWIRVSQLWAGNGYPGFMFIPRVGMEVVVTFLDGDPDRPLVTGCVHNGRNHVPDKLDAYKTKSIIRTRSTPDSTGFNELSFEDKAGDERVYLKAEKDLTELVQHDHDTRVKHCQTNRVDVDQTESIGNDQQIHVERDRSRKVDRDDTLWVLRDREHTVGNDEGVLIGRHRNTIITGDETHTVTDGKRDVKVQSGADTEEYLGGRQVTVSPTETLTVRGDQLVRVEGRSSTVVGGAYTVAQGEGQTTLFNLDGRAFLSTNGPMQLRAGDGAVLYSATAGGGLVVNASATVDVIAGTRITLSVGSSLVEITSSKITLRSSTVEIEGTSLVEVKSGGLVKLKP